MTYTQNGDHVTLEMTRDDYDRLLINLGIATSAAAQIDDKALFYHLVMFVNELNNGNPNFTPYEIPPEYAEEAHNAATRK